jgi:hypothetical protein
MRSQTVRFTAPWLTTLCLVAGNLSFRGAENATPAPTATLRATVLDAETGRPTPCTVAILDAAGRTVTESEAFKAGFRSTGRFTKPLPPGQTRLRISRGLETKAEEQTVVLEAGREMTLEFRLRRIVDLRRQGWYSGDSHDHLLHGEKTVPVDFDEVALAARAEDLQYLSLAQGWPMEGATPEKLAGVFAARSRPECVLTWNLEAPKNYYRGDAGRCLGHCWTLALGGRTTDGQDVISLLLQASAHDYESYKPSFANFESHQLIHAQGGVVFYTHPARWWTGAWGGQGGYPKQDKMRVSNMAVELPLDTLAGPTFDGLDVITGSGEYAADALAFQLWCLLLNHGYRLAATASSDACFDRPGGAVPGTARTYTYLEEPFSLAAVARATAQGRTFATTGPLLLARMDSQPPGAAFPADGQERHLAIEAWASGTDATGLTRLEVWRNGQVMHTFNCAPPVPSLKTNLAVRETEPTWYCVRAYGGDARRQRAISGAFFLETNAAQRPAPVPARVRVKLLSAETGAALSGTLTEVRYEATLPRDGRRHELRDGEGVVTIPATARLRADAPGCESLTLSPFFDHPALVQLITSLAAEDLVKWGTFERIRTLLGEVELTFRLKKAGPAKSPREI